MIFGGVEGVDIVRKGGGGGGKGSMGARLKESVLAHDPHSNKP